MKLELHLSFCSPGDDVDGDDEDDDDTNAWNITELLGALSPAPLSATTVSSQ